MVDEAVMAAAPDVVVMMSRGEHAMAPDALFALPALQARRRPRPARWSSWTGSISSASARARLRPRATSPPPYTRPDRGERQPVSTLALPLQRRPAGDRAGRARLVLGGTVLAAVAAVLLSLASGPTGVGLHDLVALAGGAELSERDRLVLLSVRLPRALMGAMVGAGLAVAGAMMQGLFRNPLADPGLVGVSSGAATAAVATIVLSGSLPVGLVAAFGGFLLPAAAFAGGSRTRRCSMRSRRGGRAHLPHRPHPRRHRDRRACRCTHRPHGLPADDAALRDVTFWSLGSLGGATYAKAFAVAPFVLAALAAIPFVARGLDAMLLGEAEAFHLGIPVQRLKRLVILAVAAAAGATVAVAGTIGFVGIVVPHLLRLVMGPTHRLLLPASAFGGAALLLAADAICRLVVAPAELPIGIVMALIGAPVFLAILLKRAGREEGA